MPKYYSDKPAALKMIKLATEFFQFVAFELTFFIFATMMAIYTESNSPFPGELSSTPTIEDQATKYR